MGAMMAPLVLLLLPLLVSPRVAGPPSTAVCGLRRNATFATMQPLAGSTATTPERCCDAMRTEPRCNQSGVFVCRYFVWKDPCCYPFPQNCEYHVAAGPFLPDPSVDGGSNATAAGWLDALPPVEPAPKGAVVSSTYTVSSANGLGLEWEGVGAISGGGATTKLLMDYDPQVASDILDYLFKPNYGASFQHLKVESESVFASGPSSSQPWRGGQMSPSHTARTG